MDKSRGIKNTVTSISSKIILLIGSIAVRRLLIWRLGNGANGIHSLYVSIVGFLSLAELGIGSAISFSMYRPIVEGDKERVGALYGLFKRAYRVIGVSVFGVGFLVSFLLPYLAGGYEKSEINLFSTYFIMLFSVALSYFYGAELSLISAHKNDYIVTLITSSAMLVQYLLQAVILIFTPSFEGYLASQTVAVGLQWLFARLVANRLYGGIVDKRFTPLDNKASAEVKRNAGAMLMHKVGSALVNSTDSIIISALIGVEALGRYANYSSVIANITAILSLIFSSLISVIGHSYVHNGVGLKSDFDKLYIVNFAVGVFFFLGFYATSEEIIAILFGEGLELSRSIVQILSLSFFIQFMRQSVLTFRDATGQFYKDRWKPIVEGAMNLVLSVALALMFRERFGGVYGIAGVLLATVITNLAVCHIVEPLVLFKYSFNSGAGKHIIKSYAYIGLFTVSLLFLDRLTVSMENNFMALFVNGAISVMVALPVIAVGVAPSLISKIRKGQSK